MEKTPGTTPSQMAKEIAFAAMAFEKERIGRAPESVTAVMSGDTLVITLHGSLSPAEKALATNPDGAAQIQEFHRQLFNDSVNSLRQEIKRITGVEVREATVDVNTSSGAVVRAFTSGTVVQVYLLAGNVMSDTWSENHGGKDV